MSPWSWIISSTVAACVAFLFNKIHLFKHITITNNIQPPEASATAKQQHSIYVIGDIHGDAHCAKYWVQRTGLISNFQSNPHDPDTWKWNDNTTTLVFLGDYIDKGPTSLQSIELVKNLTDRFPQQITAILGNHEVELLKDRHRYPNSPSYFQYAFGAVHPAEYLNYLEEVDDMDHAVVDVLYNATLLLYSHDAHQEALICPSGPYSITQLIGEPSLRKMVNEKLLHYQNEYINAFHPSTLLGQWLQQRPILHFEKNTLFLHGGLTPDLARYLQSQLPQPINTTVQKLNQRFASKAASDPTSSSFLTFLQDDDLGALMEETVWYRGNHEPDACPILQSHFSALPQIHRVAVGHTPYDSIQMQCSGKFLALDSSLGRWFRVMGNDYCSGREFERAKNGMYVCPKKNEWCEGQIVRIGDDGVVHVIDSDHGVVRDEL